MAVKSRLRKFMEATLMVIGTPLLFVVLLELGSYLGIQASIALTGKPRPYIGEFPRFAFHPVVTGQPLLFSDAFDTNECDMHHPIFGVANRISAYCTSGGKFGADVDRYGFYENGQADRNLEERPDLLIFMVGGSTVEGNGVSAIEYTIPAQLEGLLREAGIGAVVVNAGKAGYYSPQQFDLIFHEIVFFRPDVVISPDGVNDLRESIDCCRAVNGRPHTYYMNVPSWDIWHFVDERMNTIWWPLKGALLSFKRKFCSYTYFGWILYSLESRIVRTAPEYDVVEHAKSLMADKAWSERVRSAPIKSIDEGVNAYVNYVRVAQQGLAALGIEHLQVFQPSTVWDQREPTPDDSFRRDIVRAIVLENRGIDIERQARQFKSSVIGAFRTHELRFVDLSDLMPAGRDVYVDAYHYNDAGNGIIARRLLEILQQEGLTTRNR